MNYSNKTMTAEQFKKGDFVTKLVVLLVMWGILIGLLISSIRNNWPSGPAGPVAFFLGLFFLCLGAGGTGGKKKKNEKSLSGDIFAMLALLSFGHIVIYIFVGLIFDEGPDSAGIAFLITGAAAWFLEIWPARAFLGDEVKYVLGYIGKERRKQKNGTKNMTAVKSNKGDYLMDMANGNGKMSKPYSVDYLNGEGKTVPAGESSVKVRIRFFDDSGKQIREFITGYIPEKSEPAPQPQPKPQPKQEPQPLPKSEPAPRPQTRSTEPKKSLSQAEIGDIVARAKKHYQGREYEEAVKLFRQAAETGHIYSQLMLGQCYEHGRGVPLNYYEAAKWYQKAADQGDSQGQRCLGVCFEAGRGVEKDPKKAVELYRKSSAQGDAAGICCLGYCYENGIGIEQDQVIATSLYRSAAEKGNARAQFFYANNLKAGKGVPKDANEAFRWYEKAAQQDYAAAQNNLAVCYEYGEGVAKDLDKALELYRRAAVNGDDKARRNAEIIEKRLKEQAQEQKKAIGREQAGRRQEEERLLEQQVDAARKGRSVELWNRVVYGTSGDGAKMEYRVKGAYYPETSKVVIESWNSRDGGRKEVADIPAFIKTEQAIKDYLNAKGFTVY